MLIIAHRGNLNGPNPMTENQEHTITKAIKEGFDCEIDVWKVDDELWLGHDGPEHKTSLEFLETHVSKLWVHCKNLDALTALKDSFNCFFHDKDTYTLTSKGFIWGNIDSPTNAKVICVMPTGEIGECFGVCTDYPFKYEVAIDSVENLAFAHWVFESAILIPTIQNKNLVLSTRRGFKDLFCKYLGVDVRYSGQLASNPISLMDAHIRPEYPQMLTNFFSRFTSSVSPSVDFVVLPRQTKENYPPNDRPCALSNALDVFEPYSHRIVHTDTITNLQDQIDAVNSARRAVVVTDGSPFLVNGMFCKGKTMWVVRPHPYVENQANKFPIYALLLAEVRKNNTVVFMTAEELKQLLKTT
jgi:hypothetical protein